MVARCSRLTLYHRFHGFGDGLANTRALLTDQGSAETLVAWIRSACVGLATLHLDAEGIASLGVLVEDGWQRRGVGTQLVAALVARARARGATTLHADVLTDDRFIVDALRRLGRLTVKIESGTFRIAVDLGCRGGVGLLRG
jgi:GNAT superfamily N-acetyltransferase